MRAGGTGCGAGAAGAGAAGTGAAGVGAADASGWLGGATTAAGCWFTGARRARRGSGASRTGFGASNGDGFAGTPVARASAGCVGGVAGSAEGVAGAVAGGVCTCAITGAGAAVCGWNATFMITAPPMAPAASKITMCSGFISSMPLNLQ
jgi:pilus assembly protein FimV